MKLVRLRLSNFRSFGPDAVEIQLTDANFVIGPNGSGKTSVLQALGRMFSLDPSQRKIRASDFHIAADEDPNNVPGERKLWLEADFEFPELLHADENGLLPAVPGNFAHMQMETDGQTVLVRFRLAATMDEDGDIEETFTNVTKTSAEGGVEAESRVSKLERNSVQVHYLPARRDPADHVSYSANALLGRILRAANWTDEREAIRGLTSEITDTLVGNPAIAEIADEVGKAWGTLHKGKFYRSPQVSFARGEVEALLRHLNLSFTAGPDTPLVDFTRLSDGQQSLLYISLVLASREISNKALSGSEAFDLDKLRPPVFTLLAVEEPENSLSPHYLGRVIRALKAFAEGRDAQAIVATHAPSLLRRVDPADIRYLRLDAERQTVVSQITLPTEDEAEKYVRQAVRAFPELYFARLVILGEGDSEEIVLPRMLSVKGVLADDASVSVVPLGGRHVNHFWRLLTDLGIPHVTLLDLDLARWQGGWGRIRYAAKQLLAFDIDSRLTETTLQSIPKWNAMPRLLVDDRRWLGYLETQGVFFSSPLDLDFLMLEAFPEAYDVDPMLELSAPDQDAAKAVLGKQHDVFANQYTDDEQQLFDAYYERFKVGSKPSHHVKALSALTDASILAGLPGVLDRMIALVETKLEALPE